MTVRADYTRDDLVAALRRAGVRAGDVVFSHSQIGYFGRPAGGGDAAQVCALIHAAFLDVLGPDGTLCVPTFTYSFCQRQPFDPLQTPSTCGVFTEFVRGLPGATRSLDPIFSVAAVGARAAALTGSVGTECFGPESFWARFLAADGVICNLNLDAGSTFIHFVERQLGVGYRFDKLFPGVVLEKGRPRATSAIFFCQEQGNADTVAAFEPFHALAVESGAARREVVGRGALTAIRAQATYDLIAQTLPIRPWLLTRCDPRGPATPSAPACRVPALPPGAGPEQVVDALWRLPRDILSAGYDAALAACAEQVPMTVHTYPTGTRAWTWLVPEQWACTEAWLETMGGRRLFSYADHPLHVVSYSLPFEGEVTREDLLAHLHVHPRLPDAIPFVFKYYERDWGLCCTRRQRDALTDARYRVVIRSQFRRGALKVGDAVARGRLPDTVVLCAHLCHPAMVNDDLAGVAVGLEVMRRLQARHDLRYTYRLLILPETIGSLAWLSHHEAEIPWLRGGLFLEMLGLDHPHALQRSFAGDTVLDRCWSATLAASEPGSWVGDFRTVIGNDERQFNAPGVRVPMLSLSRVLPRGADDWPYREYHTQLDARTPTLGLRLAESVETVLRLIAAWEQAPVPVNRYRGEVFCSRYGIHVDWAQDAEAHRALFDVMYLIDGTRTLADIAAHLRISESAVQRVVDLLRPHGLVDLPDDVGRPPLSVA